MITNAYLVNALLEWVMCLLISSFEKELLKLLYFSIIIQYNDVVQVDDLVADRG